MIEAPPRLTLAAAARMIRTAMRDRSYRQTPIGTIVGRYYRWKKNEWGARPATLRDYEIPLSRLALDHADLELRDFEPPVGRERLREFLDHHWADRTARTRAKNLSILSDFFKWACRENLLHGDPTLGIRAPKRRDPDRRVYLAGEPQRMILSCTRGRDRCAVGLVVEFGLRKMELAGIQLADYDPGRRDLRVSGKGGRIRHLPVIRPQLRSDLGEHWLLRLAEGAPAEYLLYPEAWGPRASADGAPVGLNWQDRTRPLSSTAMHNWWKRRLAAAGLPETRKMHEMRHTAATDLLRSTGNLELVREMLGHTDIKTTAMYLHMDTADLAVGLAKRARDEADQ